MDFHLLKIKILYYYLDKNILSTPFILTFSYVCAVGIYVFWQAVN